MVDILNVERAIRARDNRLVTPKEVLLDALNTIEKGDVIKPNKAIVILLDSTEDGYQWESYRANIATSEAIALLEVMKANLLNRLK